MIKSKKGIDKLRKLCYTICRDKERKGKVITMTAMRETTIKTLKEAMKAQMNMSLTAGARQNAHSMVLIIMKTTKKEYESFENMFE